MVILRILAVLTLALLVAGYGGAVHPAGDSLAVFRVPLALLAFALCLLCRRPPVLVWGGACLAGLALLGQRPGWLAPRSAPDAAFLLYQKNILVSAADQTDFVTSVRASGADFVTLQEVGSRNWHVLEDLKQEFPYQQTCEGKYVYDVAVLSRYPTVPGTGFCHKKAAITGFQVETPQGVIWLMSLHLVWPWPYDQAQGVDLLEAMLPDLTGAKLIGGDFNSVGWAASVARVAQATDTTRIGHIQPTFTLPLIGMGVAIDHVLTSGTGPQAVQVMPRFGSDHNGLLAQVSVSRP